MVNLPKRIDDKGPLVPSGIEGRVRIADGTDVDAADLRFVAQKLWPLCVPIDSVKMHPRNPNEGDVDGIAESVETFTQYAPIVIQESTSYIAKGNHTYQAVARVGSKYIAAVPMDWDDATTLAVLVGDNRHSEKAKREARGLADILKELDEQEMLLGTGYSSDDVQTLLDALDDGEEIDINAFKDEPDGTLAYRVVAENLTRERGEQMMDLLEGEMVASRLEQYRA